MKVHNRIRNIRIAKGYTQEFVAEKLGIDSVNYGRIERGITKITVERLQQIALILEVKVSILIDGTHEAVKNEACNNSCLEKDEILKLIKSNNEMSKMLFEEHNKIKDCWKELIEVIKKLK